MSDQPGATQTGAADAATVIDGRYVLENRLGGGGMGVVYRARDRLMEKHRDRDPYVALKLISESLRDNEEARTLLQRECSRAQKLSHPNIVRVFYYGCDQKTDCDYLTMELLRGEPLERFIRANPKGLDWARAAPAIEQLCNGLEFAHAEGIVHSDIKPSNLFMTDASVLKILDFGIAAPLRNADTASSETLFNPRHTGAVAPRYSSLEMFLGKDADPSDDVYSAGCVIYELLTGRHPYQGLETPRAAELNMVPETIPSLSRAQNAALRKALNFRRRDRTGTIAELKQALLHPARSMPGGHMGYAAIAAGAVLAGLVAWIVLRTHSPAASAAATAATPAPPAAPAPVAAPTVAALAAPAQQSPQITQSAPETSPVAVPVNIAPPEQAVAPKTRQSLPQAAPNASPKITPATKALAAPNRKQPGTRCGSILERAQLGESLSDEEREYVRENCQ